MLSSEQEKKIVDILITFIDEVVKDRKNATQAEIEALPDVASVLERFNKI